MAWLTEAELARRLTAERLAQLTNDDGGAEPDADVLAEVIQDAESIVTAWVGSAYDPTQLDPIPEVLFSLAATVFTYKAYERRNATRIPEGVKEGYKMAREDLKAIARGDMSLGKTPTPPQHPSRSAVLTTTERRFSRASLKGF